MRRFFNYDNGIFRAIDKLTDCIFASILWVIFSIPIITMGASTTALCYTVRKVIRYERSGIWKEFWNSFWLNFKQSTIVWCGLLVFYLIVIYYVCALYFSSKSIGVFSVILIFLLLTSVVTTWAIYVFSYMARFAMPIGKIVKNCALIEVAHILWSILIGSVFIISFIVCFFIPIAFFVVPAYCVLICDMILTKVFRKYMSQEDLEQELLWIGTEDL